jgi:hypothetical protein
VRGLLNNAGSGNLPGWQLENVMDLYTQGGALVAMLLLVMVMVFAGLAVGQAIVVREMKRMERKNEGSSSSG